MQVKIAPSVLSADLSRLLDEVKQIEPFSDWIHLDVMDGKFVPNTTFGPEVVKQLKGKTSLVIDTHLMVENPEAQIEAFARAGSDIIVFHIEATDEPEKLIGKIHSLGCKAGISLKPGTPASAIEHLLDKVDLVLVMSVEPGFGGQKFMDMTEKIREIRSKYKGDIQVDGGIDAGTAPLVVKAGANVLVAGSAIFGKKDRKKAIEEIRHALR